MAELREADKKAIFGDDYREPVATEESRAADAAARWASIRNMLIGLAILAVLAALAVYLGRGR